MSQKSHFFEGFVFGTLVGAILGLLFAPASGIETRKKLKQFKDENEELLESTKEKTENLIQKTKEAIEEGFEKLSNIIEEKNQKKNKG